MAGIRRTTAEIRSPLVRPGPWIRWVSTSADPVGPIGPGTRSRQRPDQRPGGRPGPGRPRRVDPAHPGRRVTWLPAAAAGFTLLTWASAFVAIRHLGDDVPPGSLSLGRLLVAVLALG